MKTLGERLKLLRGKTRQADLAAALGMAQTTLSNYETGRNEPNIETIRIIISHFGVSLRWLMFGEGPMMEETSDPNRTKPPTQQTTSTPLSDETLASLERELELEREERRELAADNRRLYREKEALLLENATLREKLARLEAEQGKRRSIQEDDEENLPSLFDEQRTIRSSSRVGANIHK